MTSLHRRRLLASKILEEALNPSPEGGGAVHTNNFTGDRDEMTNIEGAGGTAIDIFASLPGVLGLPGKVGRMGIKGRNAALLDEALEAMGFSEGLGFGEKVAASLGVNKFGTGGPKAIRAGQRKAAKDVQSGKQTYKSKSRGPKSRGALGRQKRTSKDGGANNGSRGRGPGGGPGGQFAGSDPKGPR